MKYLIIVLFFIWKINLSAQIDTIDIYYAHEVCSDSTPLNCWLATEGLFVDYFIAFDGTLKGLVDSKDIHWYSYNNFNDSNSIFNINITERSYLDSNYLIDNIRNDLFASNVVLAEFLYNYIQDSHQKEDLLSIQFPKFNKWLKKKKNQKKLFTQGYDIDVFTHRNAVYNITSHKLYNIYKARVAVIKMEGFNLRKTIDYSISAKRFSFNLTLLNRYYILSIFEFELINIDDILINGGYEHLCVGRVKG